MRKPVKKWRVAYFASDGTAKDSFEWYSRTKPTTKAKNGLYANETYKITELKQ